MILNYIIMPYERKGNCVYKDTGKKVGCSKSVEGAEKYLKALYASEMKEDLGVTEPSVTPQIAIAIAEPVNEIANFISNLFASRTQAHIFHLQTPSYAQHKALNKYYDRIIDLIDPFIESYQGKYGIIRGYSSPASFREDDDTIKYFESLCSYVEETRVNLPQDSYIQNQIDEVVALIESTKYKLINLN
jgi:hypothetical protein